MTGFPDPNDPAYMDTPDVGEHPIEDTTPPDDVLGDAPHPDVWKDQPATRWTPEMLAQRDRLDGLAAALTAIDAICGLCHGARTYRTNAFTDEPCDRDIHGLVDAARLIAADVRVGPDEELRAAARAVVEWAQYSDKMGTASVPAGYMRTLAAALEGSAE